MAALAEHGVRMAAHDVKSGVKTDRGDGGAWPEIRDRMGCDILLLSTPIRLGHRSGSARLKAAP
ncbi:hypothetical protein ACFXA3_30980 [Streptomyces sp. NPDC059456]|uniref:hypothetical protein n=1 Tax=Streptomyces sp. NPDC059456 TaxID=3346838 RepID=UPI00368CD44E